MCIYQNVYVVIMESCMFCWGHVPCLYIQWLSFPTQRSIKSTSCIIKNRKSDKINLSWGYYLVANFPVTLGHLGVDIEQNVHCRVSGTSDESHMRKCLPHSVFPLEVSRAVVICPLGNPHAKASCLPLMCFKNKRTRSKLEALTRVHPGEDGRKHHQIQLSHLNLNFLSDLLSIVPKKILMTVQRISKGTHCWAFSQPAERASCSLL